jgi:hypothetical protein
MHKKNPAETRMAKILYPPPLPGFLMVRPLVVAIRTN